MVNMSTRNLIILVFIVACIALVSMHLMNKRSEESAALNAKLVTVVEPVPVDDIPGKKTTDDLKTPKAAQVVREIASKADLDELLSNTDKPVVVKFFATWCPPCRGIKALYEASAGELSHKAYFAEINIDQFDDKAHLASFNVQTIPTIIFFKNGNEAKRLQGIRNKAHIEEQLASL